MRRSHTEIELQQPESRLMHLSPKEARFFAPFCELEISSEFHPPREAMRSYPKKRTNS